MARHAASCSQPRPAPQVLCVLGSLLRQTPQPVLSCEATSQKVAQAPPWLGETRWQFGGDCMPGVWSNGGCMGFCGPELKGR